MAAKNKIIKNVTGLYLVRDATGTFGSTTLTAAAAAGAGTLTVAAITNFAVADLIRIGSGEEYELARVHGSTAPSGNTITLEANLLLAHAIGEAVVEQLAYDLGDPTDAGVKVSYPAETQDIGVATKRLLFTTLNGYVDASMEFSMPTMSLYNVALATGMLLAKVTGANTQADPIQLITDGNEFAGDTNMSLVVVGTQMDGSTIRAEIWAVDFDYTGINFALSRGQLAAVPVKAFGSGGMFGTAAPTWTAAALTTFKPTKGYVFDYINEVGYFTDETSSPGSSTVASGGAAGSNSVVLASGTNFTGGDFVRFGTGETCEIHQIQSVSVNTLTLRTRFLRSQAVGVVAVEQKKVPFAGVSKDGATLTFGGTVEKLRSATSRVTIGVRPGRAAVALSFGLMDVSLANIAMGLGVPSSEIVGSAKLPLRNKIGTLTIDGFYFSGFLQNGQNFYGHLCGCSFDVSGFEVLFNNTGDPATAPFQVKPSSALLLVTTP